MGDAKGTARAVGPDGRIETLDDHGCFGCGRLNPHGLRLAFYLAEDGNGVWAPFTPGPMHEGYAGLVHGGIIAAVLDEVMAWSLYARAVWAVTADLQIRFRRPVEVGVATRASGRMTADRGRVLEVVGELRRAEDGQLLASAAGTFMQVPEEQARAWRERYVGVEGDGGGAGSS